MFYGSDFIRRTTLTNPALEAMSSEMLLAKIGDLMGKQHEVLYYGPQSEKARLTEALAVHHKTSAELQPLDKKHLQLQPTDESKVLTGPIRRQAALLPAICEPRQTVRRRGRPRKSRSTTSISAAA